MLPWWLVCGVVDSTNAGGIDILLHLHSLQESGHNHLRSIADHYDDDYVCVLCSDAYQRVEHPELQVPEVVYSHLHVPDVLPDRSWNSSAQNLPESELKAGRAV